MCHSEIQDRQEEDHKACSDSTHITLTGWPAAGQITQPCTASLPLSTPSIIHPFIITSAPWQPTQAHLPWKGPDLHQNLLCQDINVCQLSRLKSHTYGWLICLSKLTVNFFCLFQGVVRWYRKINYIRVVWCCPARSRFTFSGVYTVYYMYIHI